MFNVEELNNKVQELGLENIHYIAESNDGGDSWSSFIDPDDDNADMLFGFNSDKCKFNDDVNQYWESYDIEENAGFPGTYDIVFIGAMYA